jgi:predicted secreted protein
MRLAAAGRTLLAATVLGLTGLAPARAQETILHIAESATVMVSPDELAATLRAEAVAQTAQEAQKRVNEMMRDAIATAKKVEGIAISTGAYNAWRVGPSALDRTDHWQAGQSLNLTGKDAVAMPRLVGDLQQKGLAQGNLIWRLSREAEQQARKDATKQALSALRGRADEAAELLGLRFGSFRDVRLDSVAPPPIMPRQGAMSRSAMAAPPPPPSVEAEDLPVSAQAEADIVLKPR